MAVKVLQACVLVAALAVGGTAECTPSTRPGYKCQQAVSLGTVHYTMLHDKSKVKLAAEAPVEGFVGIGVGYGMLGSELVAGSMRDRVPDVRAFWNIRHHWAVQRTPFSRATWATDYSVEEVNGRTTTSFTYDMADTDYDSASFPMVMATGNSRSGHDNTNTFALNLDEAREGPATPVPSPTPAPPADPTSPNEATPTPAPDTAAPAPDAGDDGLGAGAIAGIVVGCVVAVAVLAIVLVWCVRRAADSKQQEQQDEYPNEPADA